MNFPNSRAIKFLYYTIVVVFHAVLFLTDVGNFFHGGTAFELITLQVIAIVIVTMSIKFISNATAIEKFIIFLCTLIPAGFVFFSLLSINLFY